MGWLQDFVGGSRPDLRQTAQGTAFGNYLKDYMGQIGLGRAGKEDKRIINQYNEDPASLAALSLSQGAVNERMANERGGQGANALIGAGGGEQANLLQNNLTHQRDMRSEQTGLSAIGEANQKYFGALSGLQDAINSRRQNEMGTLGLMGQNTWNSTYDARRQGGLFNPAALGAGMMQAGLGAASKMLPCWVAAELYGGWDAPQVAALRDFIFNRWQTRTGKLFAALYMRFGARAASLIKRHEFARSLARRVFDYLLLKAKGEL